jgi:hypothetical protein
MASYRTNRAIRVIIVLFFVLLVIVGLAFAIRATIANRPATTNSVQPSLLSTNADRSVRLTVRGPLSAEEKFRSYSIQISPNYRNLTTYSGYLKSVASRINLNNNIPAYEQFVYALDKAGFMSGDETINNDERGVCAAGKVYEFETLLNGKTVKKLWTSECIRGNTKSSHSTISSLFINQIPGSNSIISHIW